MGTLDQSRAESIRPRRLTPVRVFAVAFVLLVGAVVGVGAAQFLASAPAAWVSLGCSAAAVALTIIAVALRRR